MQFCKLPRSPRTNTTQKICQARGGEQQEALTGEPINHPTEPSDPKKCNYRDLEMVQNSGLDQDLSSPNPLSLWPPLAVDIRTHSKTEL